MVDAMNTIRPKLQAFYGSLSDDQKARLMPWRRRRTPQRRRAAIGDINTLLSKSRPTPTCPPNGRGSTEQPSKLFLSRIVVQTELCLKRSEVAVTRIPPWPSKPFLRMGPPPRSFAADAHGCSRRHPNRLLRFLSSVLWVHGLFALTRPAR